MGNGASSRRLARLIPAAALALSGILPAAGTPAADCANVPLAFPAGAVRAARVPMDTAPRYEIDASFDPGTHRVRGRERLRWRNPARYGVCTLYLHLDLSAYENASTRWMAAQRAQGRRFDVPAGHWGYTRLTGIEQGGRPAVWMPVQPDGTPADGSLVRVDLPTPVAPGASTTLDIAFVSRLPGAWAGFGHSGTLHVAARWFPRLAALERGDNGAARWLASAPDAPRTRAAFDVRLDLPADQALAASGDAVGLPLSRGTRRIHRFRLEDAADFAWVAGRGFAPPLQYDYRPPGSAPVRLRVLYHPVHAGAAVAAMGSMVDALRRLGVALPGYPRRTLTAVVVPGGDRLGGRAYPGLFTAAGHRAPGADARAIERLDLHTVDGVGAAYFDGRLGSGANGAARERALTRYWTARILRDRGQTLHAPDRWLRHLGVSPALDAFAALRVQARLQDAADEGGSAVLRSSLALHDLEMRIGTPAMDRALRELLAPLAAGPPRATVPEVNPVQRALATAGTEAIVDDRIGLLHSEEVLPQRGYVIHRGRRVELTPPALEVAIRERRAHWQRTAAAGARGPFPFRTVVVVERLGARVPQLLEVKFADGSVRRVRWNDPRPQPRFEWITASPAVSAQLDPQRQVLLDRNKLDDGRTGAPGTAASRRWAAEVAAAVQTLSALLVGL